MKLKKTDELIADRLAPPSMLEGILQATQALRAEDNEASQGQQAPLPLALNREAERAGLETWLAER